MSDDQPRLTADMVARVRRMSSPALAPDGRRVASVVADAAGKRLVTVPVDGGAETEVVLDPPPSSADGAVEWLPHGGRIVYVAHDGLYVAPLHGGAGRMVMEGDVSSPAVSPDGTEVAVVLDLRSVAVAPLDRAGPPDLVSGDADFAMDPTWHPGGDALAWHEWDVPAMPWDSSRLALARRHGTGWSSPTPIAGGPDVAVGQPRFSPDGRHLAYLCDATGWYVVWWATEKGGFGDGVAVLEEEYEHGMPAWGPGLRDHAWSPDGSLLAHVRNDAGDLCLVAVDVASRQRRVIGDGTHQGLRWHGERLVAVHTSSKQPHRLVTYRTTRLAERVARLPETIVSGLDRLLAARRERDPSITEDDVRREVDARVARFGATAPVPLTDPLDRVTVLRSAPAGLDEVGLPDPELVRWAADDGTQLAGRLHLPRPLQGTPPPLLLWIHGGPTGQWVDEHKAAIAYFADRGYAVLVPDFRGSTGHGRRFTQALRGRWGELDVADCAAALRAAGARGWGDPSRVAVVGPSSGGMTALLLLAHHGDLLRAGVDLYGVTDLHALQETTWRFEAHYNDSLLGALPAAADVWAERSPLTYIDRIRRPLLVMHGDVDEVVPLAQSEQLVRGVNEHGGCAELVVYEGEGHGSFRDPAHVVDHLVRMEGFLARHVLGHGDHQ